MYAGASVVSADRRLDILDDRGRERGSSPGGGKGFADSSVLNIAFDASSGSAASIVGGTAGHAALSRDVKLAALSGDGKGCSGDVGETIGPRFVYEYRTGAGERRSCVGGTNVTGS